MMQSVSKAWVDFKPIGKRTKTEAGYIIVRCPGHPNANKGKHGEYIYEHRLVMANYIRRPLTADEVVHHKNGNKSDNRIENLELLTNATHMKMHGDRIPHDRIVKLMEAGAKYQETIKKPRTLVPCACGCGTMIEMHDSKGRPRKYAHGHNAKGKHWRWQKKDGTDHKD